MTPLTIAFYLTALFVSLILQLVLAGYAFRRRTTPGAVYFVMLALAVAGILLGFILSLFSHDRRRVLRSGTISVRYSLTTSIGTPDHRLPPAAVASRTLEPPRLRRLSCSSYLPSPIALIVTNSLHGLYFQAFFLCSNWQE